MLGYGPGVRIGLPVQRRFIHPDDMAESAAKFWAIDRGELDTYSHDLRLRRADGSWCWFTTKATRVDRSNEGRPLLICGSLTEIDHLNENEARLADAAAAAERAQAQFNALTDNMPGAVAARQRWPDGTTAFPYFSAKFPDLFGTTPAAVEADGGAVFAHMHPQDRDMLIKRNAESANKMTPFEFTARINHPDKGLRRVTISSLPLAQPDGSIIWYGSINDVTAQQASEQRAVEAAERSRQLEERLRLATEAAGIGIWDLDLVTGRNSWDDTMHRLYGLIPGGFEGDYESWSKRLHPDDAKRSEGRFQKAVATRDDFIDEFRIRLPYGATRDLKARARLFFDDEGQAQRVTASSISGSA